MFGENLTTVGIDVNEAELGEQWRVGTALLEVRSVRIPCNDFKCWLGENGFDNTGWVKRFAADERPGPYLRVVEAGVVEVGDPVSVEHRPGHGVTVSMHVPRGDGRERAAAGPAAGAGPGGEGPRAGRAVRRRRRLIPAGFPARIRRRIPAHDRSNGGIGYRDVTP